MVRILHVMYRFPLRWSISKERDEFQIKLRVKKNRTQSMDTNQNLVRSTILCTFPTPNFIQILSLVQEIYRQTGRDTVFPIYLFFCSCNFASCAVWVRNFVSSFGGGT